MNFSNSNTAKVFYCDILNSTYGIGSLRIPEIKNVIFNDPATIVFWEDGTKTVVKCQDCDEFDPEKGLAMAIVKKAYGNKGSYCNKLKKWLPKEKTVDISKTTSGPYPYTFSDFSEAISDVMRQILDSSQKPKKQMTFREEVAKKEPERIDVIYRGGVAGCPRDKCVSRCHIMNQVNCTKCWDREIPDELMDND